MRFSLIVALFASAVVLAAPFEQVEQEGQVADLSEAEAIDLLEQYDQLAAMDQDSEFIGPLLRAGVRMLPKLLKVGGRVAKKGAVKHGADIADAAAGVADASSGDQ